MPRFATQPNPNRIVVFAPHPDDETVACGGTIAMSVDQGKDVHIVVMTDGRNSHKITLSISRNPSPHDLIPIRRNELKRATKVLGVQRDHLTFLKFEDGFLKSYRREAKQIVKRLLAEFSPGTIFIPDKSDTHSDHSTTGSVVSEAARSSKPRPRIYSYVVWTKDGSRDWGSEMVDFDISRYLTIKRTAIREYKSQFTRLFKSQGRPIIDRPMLSRFLVPTERFALLSAETP